MIGSGIARLAASDLGINLVGVPSALIRDITYYYKAVMQMLLKLAVYMYFLFVHRSYRIYVKVTPRSSEIFLWTRQIS